jgi:thiamine kinase-like enzyme
MKGIKTLVYLLAKADPSDRDKRTIIYTGDDPSCVNRVSESDGMIYFLEVFFDGVEICEEVFENGQWTTSYDSEQELKDALVAVEKLHNGILLKLRAVQDWKKEKELKKVFDMINSF